MPPEAATIFDNLVSDGQNVKVRFGYEQYVDVGTAAVVDTLMQWTWQGSTKLLCASSDSIFDITTTTPSTLGTGFVSAQWQWVLQNNFTIMVNGVDPGQTYDGTTLTAWTPTLPGTYTTNDLIVIGNYKERVFTGVKDSLTILYGAPQAITGTYSEFPLDSIATKGGTIVAISQYSRDTGAGPDDFITFFTSEGELISYTGNDPGNPSAWSLVGVYELPRPIGLRAVHRPQMTNGSVITEHGYYLVDEIVNQVPRANRLGRAVENAVLAAHKQYEAQFGWDIVDFSHFDLTLVNIPDGVGGAQFNQFVVHGAGTWQRFTNMNARCWIEWDDRLFFGTGEGIVHEAGTGFSDNGDNLQFDAKVAYNYYGLRNRRKRWYSVQLMYRSLGKFPVTIDWDVDFQDKAPAYQASPTQSVSTPWSSPWSSPWAAAEDLVQQWFGVRGQGYAGALRLRGSTVAQPFVWYSWQPLFEVLAIR